MKLRSVPNVVCLVLSTACGGPAIDVEPVGDDAGPAPGTAASAPPSPSSPPMSASARDPSTADAAAFPIATLYGAAQVQAAQTLCNAPHGPAEPATTIAQISSLVTGAWFFCSWEGTPYPGQTATSQAFLPGGQWVALQPDGNGGLAQGQGLDSQGTWTFDSTDASDGVVWVNTNGGGDDDHVGFETDPRRLRTEDTSGTGKWYVTLEP